jgi:hypothetical protein
VMTRSQAWQDLAASGNRSRSKALTATKALQPSSRSHSLLFD